MQRGSPKPGQREPGRHVRNLQGSSVGTIDLLLASGRISTFLQLGSRPTILLIHGNSSCKEIFVHQTVALRNAGYGVLAPDLPGHGGSANARTPSRAYSFPGYAATIGGLLDKLCIAAVHVVGWSLGGHIRLGLPAADKRVRSLMITGTPPIKPGPSVVQDAFLNSPAMSLTGKRRLDPGEDMTYGECMMGARRYRADYLVSAIRRTDGNARYWMVKNGLDGIGTDEVRTVRTSKRTLAIVHGTREAFVSAAYLESLRYRALWRGAIQYVDTGHAPHWQRPKVFNKLLLQFLEETTASGH